MLSSPKGPFSSSQPRKTRGYGWRFSLYEAPALLTLLAMQCSHKRTHYLMLMYCFPTAWLWEIQILGFTELSICQSNKEGTIVHFHSWKLLSDRELWFESAMDGFKKHPGILISVAISLISPDILISKFSENRKITNNSKDNYKTKFRAFRRHKRWQIWAS